MFKLGEMGDDSQMMQQPKVYHETIQDEVIILRINNLKIGPYQPIYVPSEASWLIYTYKADTLRRHPSRSMGQPLTIGH